MGNLENLSPWLRDDYVLDMRANRSVRALSVLLSGALLAVACGGNTDDADIIADPETADLIAPTTAVSETTAAPESTAAAVVEEDTGEGVEDDALDADAERALFIEEITLVLRDWQAAGDLPAVSLSVHMPDGEPINIALGVADLQTDVPVTTEDYFRIGSITKPMTAAIVLQLVDEGLIELDATVESYLPGWLEGYEYADEITIRQLLNHTNGLVEYALSPSFYALAGQRSDVAITPEEIREWLARQQPLFAPGTEYQYETGGFLTLGDVIELVTGNSAAAEMRARIFEPAGAENIYLTPEEFPPTPVVNGYGRAEMYLAGTVLVGREDTDGLTILDEPVIDLLGQPQEVLQSAGWTGGGNEAQLESVAAIMGAMFDGTILSDEQIAEMTAPTLDVNYGLGIDSSEIDGVRVYSHGGGVPGFRSQGNYLPDFDISWAVSTNLIPLPEGASVNDLRNALNPVLVAAAG